MQEIIDRVVDFLKANKLVSSIGGVGLGCLLVGLFSLNTSQPDSGVQFASASNHISTQSEAQKSTSSKALSSKDIVVDVAGAVQKPGVYILHAGARVKDAIIAAGGFSSLVDRVRVAQSVNLATSLTDGAKLYIPASGEQMMTSAGVSTNTAGGVLGATSQLVNINQGSESDLDGLPGVGKVTADKIIANRPYGSLQELVDKKVVGASLFSKIKDKLTLY